MNTVWLFGENLLTTVRDLVPIVVVIIGFRMLVLRQPMSNPAKLAWGFLFVILGLAFFLTGLRLSLFPLGQAMAEQLTNPAFIGVAANAEGKTLIEELPWYRFYWTYLFAFTVGLSTTIAEPSLIAVANKAEEVSGGTVNAWGLRLTVALGVGLGVALGTFRIVIGISLPWFIIAGYVIVVMQTFFAPKAIVPLAYDSGGVTTSTVTVPLVAALGLGLSRQIPGRDPLIDGFGLIAFASVFPMMTVLAYAQIAEWRRVRRANQPD
ncbi:MAG: DUF1538 domain-containing protein [Planctomycetaceae bacterium]|nr:DUF1538 domain-containing protein [Planctomycetaceae bacterium]